MVNHVTSMSLLLKQNLKKCKKPVLETLKDSKLSKDEINDIILVG